jgi:hypothetical protein
MAENENENEYVYVIDWVALSVALSRNPNAIDILDINLYKLYSRRILKNPNASHILKQN